MAEEPKLDRKYLEEHSQAVHTRESFGAAVVDIIMRNAIDQIGDGEAASLELTIPVRIEPRRIRRSVGDDIVLTPDKAIPVGPFVIDCVSIGIGIPPVVASIHLAV